MTSTGHIERTKRREANKGLLRSKNPLQQNDYILLEPPQHHWKLDLPFPCDYKLACILPALWELGFVTTGSDQGTNGWSAFIIFSPKMEDGTDALESLKVLLGKELRINLCKDKILRSQKHPLPASVKFVLTERRTLLQFRFHPMWIERLAQLLGIDSNVQERVHFQKQKGGLYFRAWLKSKTAKK